MSITSQRGTAPIRQRLADLRGQLKERREESAKLREEFAEDGAQATATRLARSVNNEVEIKATIEDLESRERAALRQMAGAARGGGSDNFLDDPAMVDTLSTLAHNGAPIGPNFPMGSLVDADELIDRFGQVAREDWRSPRMAADPSVPESALSRLGPYQGVVSQLRRELTVLDLLPTQSMEGNSFVATTEGGSYAGPAETAELQLAPDADITLTDFTVFARMIKGYFKVSRPALDDVPGLSNTLNTRLFYAVRLRMENQILSGDGTGENLLGILNTTGIGTSASAPGDTVNADLVLNALTVVQNSNAVPTGVILNPSDWNHSLKAKSAGSGMRLDSDGAYSGQMRTIWGVPVVLSAGIAAGTALIGDWTLGATLFIREGVHVVASDADQDDFLRSRLTLMGQTRVGFVTWRAACFCKVTLSFPA
jgi:hypothetical protein